MRFPRWNHSYELVPLVEDGTAAPKKHTAIESKRGFFSRNPILVLIGGLSSLVLLGLSARLLVFATSKSRSKGCDSVQSGFGCEPDISQYWGQYSPYFSIPGSISPDVPDGCQITLAQVLSRHGARDPTASKSVVYAALLERIKGSVDTFSGDYTFLSDYNYSLGADQLTTFGQQQMVNSGVKYYQRYGELVRNSTIFVRSSSQERVLVSAQNFTQGYHLAQLSDRKLSTPQPFPIGITELREADGSNNTLSHGLCTKFETGFESGIGDRSQQAWLEIFAPPITTRLNAALPGANLSNADMAFLMDLCPFHTVASPKGIISPFCRLFTQKEWREYDYYQSLGKYYGYGDGNPLGPTQGVGFTNELIARMTYEPVNDHTSVNHTLDDSPETFPIGKGHILFADFSHDNDLTAIFSALGLYNSTRPLSNTTMQTAGQTSGYSASWSVPFAARAYIEKMKCSEMEEEAVRILVNDRVVPLTSCKSDKLGRCALGDFVKSLEFAIKGGDWSDCFD